MSDEKTPEELRREFKLIVGGKGGAPAVFFERTLTLEELEAMQIDYTLCGTTKGKTEQYFLTVEGTPYEIEYVDTGPPKMDFGILEDPMSDDFIFVPTPPKPSF